MPAHRFSLQLQAAYSELLEQLQTAELEQLSRHEGSFAAKNVKGARYWYFRRRAGSRIDEVYLGRESPELLERIESLRSKSEDAKAAAQGRRGLVRQIRAGGYLATDRRTGRVLEELARAGVFRLGATLVGTHAFRCYGALLGVRLAGQLAATSDLDIAQGPAVPVAIGERTEPDLAKALAAAERFVPIPSLSALQEASSWQTPDRQLRVELLVPEVGRPSRTNPLLKALGAHAQPLRFLDYVLEETQPAAVVSGTAALVRVPTPERFALHKLIVSQRRGRWEQDKSRKDLAQARALLTVLASDRTEDLQDAWDDLVSRGPSWKKHSEAALDQLPSDLRSSLSGVGLR